MLLMNSVDKKLKETELGTKIITKQTVARNQDVTIFKQDIKSHNLSSNQSVLQTVKYLKTVTEPNRPEKSLVSGAYYIKRV